MELGFNELFRLVKTRDSCKPEKAMEPSVGKRKRSPADDPVLSPTSEPSTADEREQQDKGASLFVPVKRGVKMTKHKDNSVATAFKDNEENSRQ